MPRRFTVPPNWATPPEGWEPEPGWQPLPEWGPAPEGWQFWVEESSAPLAHEQAPAPSPPPPPALPPTTEPAGDGHEEASAKIPLFGARGRARELSAEVIQLRVEVERIQAQMGRLGVLDVVELEARREELRKETTDQQAGLTADLTKHAAMLETQIQDARRREEEDLEKARREVAEQEVRLQELRDQVVVTEESAILQEVGLYKYRHPLTDAAAYKEELARLQDEIRSSATSGDAVTSAQSWTVNGSAAEGRRMIKDYSRLILRAYNAEADNLVRGLKPYKLASASQRLEKVTETIERLGKTMSIRVASGYHQLRVRELELTADYLEKVTVEKERAREARERLREEAKVALEMERERQRLEKERQHYLNAIEAMEARYDTEAAERLRGQLGEVDKAIEDVDYRAVNIRAGYVYVISNVGAFGPRMVKIGLTRRIDPMERVRELGDASVPFKFDVHALFFSKDAVGIETAMHARLTDRRVNRVNMRREFFYATPAEARDRLLELTGDLVQFEESPEALEYHQSSGPSRPSGERPRL